MRAYRDSARRGFTLLEVMVAVAILGLCLTAIFSAQAGAVKNASTARNYSAALGLARCKMSELEEHLLKDGFQELDESDTGRPCCEGDDGFRYRCSWRIEKPTLPDGRFGDLNLGAGLDLNTPNSLLGAGNNAGSLPLDSNAKPGDVAGALAGLVGPSPAGGADAMGALGGLGPGAVGAIAQMAMTMVYPSLKLVFEASTRRITVAVTWREGERDYGFDLAQWVTSPQKAGVTNFDPNEVNPLTGQPTGGTTGGATGGTTNPGGGR